MDCANDKDDFYSNLSISVNEVHLECANHGCSNKCTYSNVSKIGIKKYRTVCSDCHKSNYQGEPLAEGVTPFRKGECSNKDGHLGFDCITDFEKLPEHFRRITEIDHINGNGFDNRHENLQELCKYCHIYKGIINKDFRTQNHNLI